MNIKTNNPKLNQYIATELKRIESEREKSLGKLCRYVLDQFANEKITKQIEKENRTQ